MSSVSYGQLSPTGTSVPHEFRRPSAGFASYDPFPRRRSPSPGPSSFARRSTYDSYKPRNGAYYDDYPNSYRPNVYRPQRHHSRSPSPPRYDRARPQDSRQWDHASRWPYKRLSPSPPPWDKNHRDTLAERMFEPQEAWKQPHFDRPARYELLDSSLDRYGDRRQSSRDLSPQRPAVRSDFVTHYDSYRPTSAYAVRDLGSFSRTADTYRPQYLDDAWPSSYTGDGVGSQRRLSNYDRADDHQGSSISSTPPRLSTSLPKSQQRSSPPCPLAEAGESQMSPRPSSVADSGLQSLSSASHSRGSSVFRERPDTKLESRSRSRSPRRTRPGISEPDEEFTLPLSLIQPVLEKAPAHDTNAVPLPGGDSHSPLEGSKSLGMGTRAPADKQSSNCEATHVNGNHIASQEVSEPSISPLLIIKSASFNNAIPYRELPHDVVTPPVGADSMITDSLRYSHERSSRAKCSVAAESSTSTERVAPDIFTESLETNEHRDLPQSSAAILPSSVQISQKESDAISSAIEPGSDIDHTNVISTPEQVPNSLRIVVSDHSTTSAFPANRSVLSRPSNLKSVREGVRLVLVTRLRCDRQSPAERIYPVLRANQVVSNMNPPPFPRNKNRQPVQLFTATSNSSDRMASHEAIRSSLVDHFAERQSEIVEKARRLKTEYLALHERWLEHCTRLDELQKAGISEESAVPSGGRTTRRSTATMGDAVRSDLEMEQIIASLGVEELTDPSYLAIKNVAKIPDMISVAEGSVPYLYDDTNNIVDDPLEFYGASSGQDYWTEEERNVFLSEFAAHPKQFGLIAQRLPNKTAAQCVTYYYLHKKQGVDFRKAVMQYGTSRRRRNGRAGKQRGNALLADIRRHDDEVSRTSPGSVNEAVVASTGTKRKRGIDRSNGESRRSSASRRCIMQTEVTSFGTTPDPDVELPRRRRRTAISARAVTVITADEVVNNDVVECPVLA